MLFIPGAHFGGHLHQLKAFATTLPSAGQKWTTLEHNGVLFPSPYKPHGVKMFYDGKPIDLSPDEEEVATSFAIMKSTAYVTKAKFIENFWSDWKQVLGKKHVIQKFELCDFTPIYEWHLNEEEKKKRMSTKEKKQLKEEKLKEEEKYMWAIVDGVKHKVGNFRVEPPGLFCGQGEHPKMGKLKKYVNPEDITINIGKDASIPECPIPGHRWKEVKHDRIVTWLDFWYDSINLKELKYVFLDDSSSLKGESDMEKYEKARMLKGHIDNIRDLYTKDFKSQNIIKRQISIATYLIDRLALRVGNQKDDNEADTVGCCTLKVENVKLLPPKFVQLQDTTSSGALEKIVGYQKANKEVAILCNHQRSGSKSYNAQMDKLSRKMTEFVDLVKELEIDLIKAKNGKRPLIYAQGKPKRNLNFNKIKKKIAQTNIKMKLKMKLKMRRKDDFRTLILETSKKNYLDPRITVAWCKRHDNHIEKIFSNSLLAKFAWAMDVKHNYRF